MKYLVCYIFFLFLCTYSLLAQNATITATVTSATMFSVNFIPTTTVGSTNQNVTYGIAFRIPKALFTPGTEPDDVDWGYTPNAMWSGTPNSIDRDGDPSYWVYRFTNGTGSPFTGTFTAATPYLLASFTLPPGVTMADIELVDYASNIAPGGGPGSGGTTLIYSGANRINDTSGPFSATMGSTGAASNCGAVSCTSTLPLMNSPLPIELLRFEARINQCDVSLYWETASEKNFGYFQIEASKDGRTFKAVEQKKPQSPNSSSLRTYKYPVPVAYQGYYFRLKSVDLDGAFEYSEIRYTESPCKKDYTVQLYPNPNYLSELTVEVNSPESREQVQLFLIDNFGKRLREQKID